MIQVTDLKGKQFIVNAELIELVESTPDTMIRLTTGKSLIVLESKEDIVSKVIQYKRQINTVKNRDVLT